MAWKVKNEIPIGMRMYRGSDSEKPVLRSLIEDMKKRSSIKGRTVQVADKGLNCANNIIKALLDGDGYIFSRSVRTLSEKERRALLLSALDGDFAYVDIEEDVKKNDVEEKARAKGVKIIRSFHDFSGIPDDIYESAAEQRYVYSSGSTVDYFGEKVDEAEIVGVLFRAYGEETVDYSIVNGEFFLNHSGDAVFISLDGDSLTLSMEGKDNLVFTRM